MDYLCVLVESVSSGERKRKRKRVKHITCPPLHIFRHGSHITNFVTISHTSHKKIANFNYNGKIERENVIIRMLTRCSCSCVYAVKNCGGAVAVAGPIRLRTGGKMKCAGAIFMLETRLSLYRALVSCNHLVNLEYRWLRSNSMASAAWRRINILSIFLNVD